MNLPSSPVLQIVPNPLLRERETKVVDLDDISSPTKLRMARVRDRKRLFLDQRRVKGAKEALAGLDHDTELYGFTKGQFSLLDTLVAILELTGPARLDLSTWTAARHEIKRLADLHAEGKMTGVRFLMDVSFARRDPTAAHMIRQAFGVEAVRIAQTHAKFALFGNEAWKLVLRTSMNLNMNPRFEDFTIAHDPELFAFVETIMDEVWAKQKGTLQHDDAREARRVFAHDL